MQIRFDPRQAGWFGKSKRGTKGHGDLYDDTNPVTQGEIDHVKNSEITPYRHKPNHNSAVPSGAYESNIQERITTQAIKEAAVNYDLLQKAAGLAAQTDAAVPAQYWDEPRESGNVPGEGGNIPCEKPADGLGTDADGKILFKDDIIAMIQTEVERRRTERLPLELQWQLNSNFYDGNQYCDINPSSREIMQYPRCYEWEQHEIFNRIAPLIETRVANLKKINHAMVVNPATNEMDDYQKAQVSTAILRHTQTRGGFNMKKDSLILWNELCGSCFWLTWWDSSKGEVYSREETRYEDENGETARQEREICEGDVEYGLLTPYEVYPESIFKQTVADQRSIIVEQVKTIDEIESLYNIRVEGTEIDSFTLTPIPAAGGLGYEATVVSMSKAKMSNCQKVTTYFERKTRAYPRGRMAILVGDSDLVYYGVLPYDNIPIVRTVCKERAGQFFGKSVIEELIPLQRAYNNACNDIAEWIKRLKSPQHKVLQGSVDMDEYEEHANEPGAILVFRDPSFPPQTEQNLHFSGEVFTQKYDLERQMEYVAAVSQLMVYGQTPSGVTSGVAIENLRDIDNTRLALTGDYIRAAVQELAKMWLSLYKRYAGTYRVIQYTGKNDIGGAIVWSKQDITSYDVEFSTENELMFSGNAQWERALQLLTAGVQDQNLYNEVVEQIRTYIKTGNHHGELTVAQLQEQAAVREFVFLREGVLPTVKEIDDNSIHAGQHLKDILQLEFQLMAQDSPEIYNYALAHYQEHAAILRQSANNDKE
jgi:hypothetical protein